MTLEWVGAVPGKREFRRFIGDYTLTQTDILKQTSFEDRVGFGGWSIDLHPPGGVYATGTGSKHWYANGSYHIPLRSLYSANVSNLWLAGRDISASHVAFGSTRVMATCAVTGEAAGSAAALAVSKGVSPRKLARHHIEELQQTMLRQDAALLGVDNCDPADLARRADVTASSALTRLAAQTPAERIELDTDRALLFPVDPELDAVELLVDAVQDTVLDVVLYDTGKPQNYVPSTEVATARTPVSAGEKQWVRIPLPWRPEQAQNAFLVVRHAPGIALYAATDPLPGVLRLHRVEPEPQERDYDQPVREWRTDTDRRSWCFRATPDTAAYAPAKAVGGYHRPYGGPQMWASESEPAEQSLQLTWPEPVTIRSVDLVFDDDVHDDLINLHHHRTDYDVPPDLVRAFRIEARTTDAWQALTQVTDNRRRHRTIALPEPLRAQALRIVIEATHGGTGAHVVSLRAYE